MNQEQPYSPVETSKKTGVNEIITNDYYRYIMTAADDDAALEMIKNSYRDAIIEANDVIMKEKEAAILKAKQDSVKVLDSMFQWIDKILATIFHLTKDSKGFLRCIYKFLNTPFCIVSFVLLAPVFFIVKIWRNIQRNTEAAHTCVIAILIGLTSILFFLYYITLSCFVLSIVCGDPTVLKYLRNSILFYGLGITMFFIVWELNAKNDLGTSIAFLSLIISTIALICTFANQGGK